RGLRGRALVGSGGRNPAARARIPRPRACPPRDHHRQGPPARLRARAGPARRHGAHDRVDRAVGRARARGRLAPGHRARPGPDEGHLVTGAEAYRRRIEASLADGSRFAGLYAASDGSLVRTLLAAPGGSIQLETVTVEEGGVPSIVDLAGAAGGGGGEAAGPHGAPLPGRTSP